MLVPAYIGLLARDSCVVLDKDGHLHIDSLDTDGERGNVEQAVLGLLRCGAVEDGSLDSSTKDDGLVGVDRLDRLLAIEEVTDDLLDARKRVEPPTRTYRSSSP